MRYIDSEEIELKGVGLLEGSTRVLVPGGLWFARSGTGKDCRRAPCPVQQDSYLGNLLGMQGCVESSYARSVARWADANSTEFDRPASHPVVVCITEWQNASE